MKPIFWLMHAMMLLGWGCKNRPAPPQIIVEEPVADLQAVERKLVEAYHNGQLTRCRIDSNTVYFGSRNAPDAGAEVYDASGVRIGGCNYNTRQLHPYCEQTSDCEDIYRISPNIWGQPGVAYKQQP